ncbi:MAG: glycosyltransferase N-terminal domain-containing protein [Porphyromonas sp.]|nr:glycosyltransferase N-terminal domain-containing protein [Porphyromonas sp.]
MRRLLYSLAGHLVNLGLYLASRSNDKARRLLIGRTQTIQRLRTRLDSTRPTLWIHASSLGEFEQGRPFIELLRASHPEWQIVLSFYSPSGYEVRHSYEVVDAVVYLLGDTPREVKSFLDACRPSIAVFIKYDFWPVMLEELTRRSIDSYLISAIFREEQVFFRPWAGLYRRVLRNFRHLFVQDDNSVELLRKIGIDKVSIAGDTRFDRVEAIAESHSNLEELDLLRSQAQMLLVAGSTWGIDEHMLIAYATAEPSTSIVFAPHELEEERMQQLEQHFGPSIARLSHLREGKRTLTGLQHLIIDSFGLLSSLYSYADIAYVGGGFGKSIHNTIEAAVYGVPVVFGPRHHKFREAQLLLARGAGYSVEDEQGLIQTLIRLGADIDLRQRSGAAARQLVVEQLGATQYIMNKIMNEDKR